MDIKIGDRFGYLTIVGIAQNGKTRTSYRCKCDCGNYINIGKSHLIDRPNRRGNKSCGCKMLRQNGNVAKYFHLYTIWNSLSAKCYDPKHASYDRYGAKGITVCEEWLNSFEAFLNWSLENGYNRDLTLDRIDGTKGYYPENCRWTTIQVQALNKGLNKNNKTGYKGITFNKKTNKYIANIFRAGKGIYLGSYSNIEEAIEIRKKAELFFLENNTLDGFIVK